MASLINLRTNTSNLLVIDSEVIGDVKRCICYDISIIVYNIKTQVILYNVNYLITDIIRNDIAKALINLDKYTNISDYNTISIKMLQKKIISLINKYKISVISGYIIDFDLKALKRLFNIKNLDTDFIDKLKILDLKQVGLYIKNTKHYKAKNFITKNNNTSYKLNDISNYILQSNFKQLHIAKIDNFNNVLLLKYSTSTLKYKLKLK